MIHKLSYENFYSFMGEVEINLVVDENAPDTNGYFKDTLGNRLTKLIAVVGSNASGKTTLLKSLAFLRYFAVYSFGTDGPEKDIVIKPFLFSTASKNSPSIFNLEFGMGNNVYQYELKVTTKKVIKEKLSVKGKTKPRILFDRSWNNEKNKYNFSFKNFGIPADFAESILPNVSVLSACRQIKHKQSLEFVNYFDKIQTNIFESGKEPTAKLVDVLEYYDKHPEFRERAEDILSKFDINFSKLDIEKVGLPDKKIRYFGTVPHKHIDSGEETSLPLQYESTGTKNLLILLSKFLVVLRDGGVAVLDEMDSDLHPRMLPEIINLFSSKTHNPRNAQLLFSTHSVQILNSLDKQQIILVEKDNNGVSEAWGLDEVKGARVDDNFYAKYMAGAYGAVPKFNL